MSDSTISNHVLTSTTTVPESPSDPQPGVPATGLDSGSALEIDQIVDKWSEARDAANVAEREIEDQTQQFLHDFQSISTSVVRPEMEKVIQRLKEDGGDGRIEEHPVDVLHKPRITLWMSLQGDIVGVPHQDRNPFLQLDANLALRRIDVWEGDMIDKRGTSRATSPWQLTEVTSQVVADRIIDVLRRAGTHGIVH